MKNADKFVVGGQVYDVLSPATFGDYMETIGSACINPDGYAENKLFLAYDDNVQKLFRATTAIAYSELLIKDTNCEPTTMAEALANALSAGGVSYDNSDSGLTASNVQDAIDEVNGDVETVNNDLSNLESAYIKNGSVNICPNNFVPEVTQGVTFTIDTSKVITADSNGSAAASNANVAVSDGAFKAPAGRYKLTGCPANGGTGKYWVYIYNRTTSQDLGRDEGSGFVFDYNGSDTLLISISVRSGYVANQLKFKPMISPAELDLSYDDYVPYAKTNRELTKVHEEIKGKYAVDGTNLYIEVTGDGTKTYKTLLETLATSFNSLLSNLDSDEMVIIDSMDVAGYTSMTPNTKWKWFSGNTYSGTVFNALQVGSTSSYLSLVQLKTSGSAIGRAAIASNSYSYTDSTNSAVTSGGKIRLFYTKYKQII